MTQKRAILAFVLQILGGLLFIAAVVIAAGNRFGLPSTIIGGAGLVLVGVGWVLNQTCEPID